MAGILNKIILALMKSTMKNLKKYKEILAIYKAVLHKAPGLYPFIKTDFLTEETDFLAWFEC
jgi:hypothetical protein